MRWGADLGQKPPEEESTLLPTQIRLVWEQAAGWTDHQDIRYHHQLPLQQFPKWVLWEPILLAINSCCTEVTYQSQCI